MKRLFVSLVCVSLFGITHKPWFGKLFEFEFKPEYLWRYYSDIDNGFNPRGESSVDQAINLDFGVSPWPTWEVQFEMDFADTKLHSWSYLSTALYVRYLLLDDVAGDTVSLTLGGLLRTVNSHFLDDVSVPYHANMNLEFYSAIGKEFDKLYNWSWRTWGVLGLGIGNRGAPYLKGDFNIDGKLYSKHQLTAFANSLWGLGGQSQVNVDDFHSYANIGHHSIDLGARYAYHFEYWGALSLSYAYRVYARSFPEDVHTLRIQYRLPFSLF